MKPIAKFSLTIVFLLLCWSVWSIDRAPQRGMPPKKDPTAEAVDRGIRWLISVQGADGGWGQDGGEMMYVRQGIPLESSGNDLANTCLALQALIRAGHTPNKGEYRGAVQKGVQFVLSHIEKFPDDGLAVTKQNGTQIQRKLGPYIDTFLSSMLLAELDGTLADAGSNARVRRALNKCVAKIERNQQKDGSWNLAGGWAPILGTSIASRSLFLADQKGVAVNKEVARKAQGYAKQNADVTTADTSAAAGVPLYQSAQVLEELSRTDKDRQNNKAAIASIGRQLSSDQFIRGFGSMGGEEFFSYLNISDSLRRTGGDEWSKWNAKIKGHLVQLQNQDGTWAGHHCITGRVACTSAAVLTLLAEQTLR